MIAACDPLALVGVLKGDLGPMNLMCDRAEMFELYVHDRTKAVFEYFGLPFESQQEGWSLGVA